MKPSNEHLMMLANLENQFGIPQGLLAKQQQAESNFNPNAVSPVGARGIAQFMPATAKQYGIDPTDPIQSSQGQARMMSELLTKYKGDVPSALAAYNWGQGNVDKKGLQNAPEETRNYIAKIAGTAAPITTSQPQQQDPFSQAMNAIGNAIIPSAQAEEMPTWSDAAPPQQTPAAVNLPSLQQPDLEQPAARKPAQTHDVQMPDGTIIQGVPVGTTKEQLQAKLSSARAQPQAQPQKSNYLRALADTAAQGLTFGTADEIGGGIESLITGKPYQQIVDTTRQRLQDERKDYPVSTFIADMAGSFALPVGGFAKLAKSAPSAVSALKAFAEANPIKFSGAIGASSGAARGAGEGTDEQSRLENAGIGAGFGAAAGTVGAAIGGKIANLLAGKKPAQAPLQANTAAQLTPDVAPTASPTVAPLTQNADELFPKTAGQRTQVADIQRLENNAIAGTISPKAQEAGFDMLNKQNESFKKLITKIGGDVESGRNINGILDDVSKTVQGKAGELKASVNDAYELAKQGKGVKIGKAEIQQGLWKNIAEIRREGGYDITQMPNAKTVLQRLGKYSQDRKGTTLTNVKLGELENFRKQASQARQRTTDPTEKKFLGDVVRSYDNFMENTAASAVDIGDKNAINAFKTAVKTRAEYGKLFQSNKLVEDIVSGEKSLDDTVKAFMGTGAIKGKTEMANNLQAVLTATGKEADNVRADLQNAFMKRLYDRVSGGKLEGKPDATKVSPAKLKTELENLFVHQEEFATKLYGKDAVKTANKAIKELSLINSQQPSTKNASGSGEMIQRYLMPIMEQAPVVGKLVAGSKRLGEIAKTQKDTKAAVEALSGALPKDFSFAPKSKIWNTGTALGAAGGGSLAGQGTRKEIPVIEINKGAK